MLKRILTAVVALAVLVPVLLFAPDWVVLVGFSLLAAFAVYEVAGCVGLRREWCLTALSMLLCVGYLLAPSICEALDVPDDAGDGRTLPLGVSMQRICVSLLVLTYIVAAVARHKQLSIDRLLTQFGMTVYTTLGFGSLCKLAPGVVASSLYVRPLLWAALCIPWVADTLAYFTGYFLGKHKLCPEISPKKTVEGAIGGVIGTGIAALIVYGCIRGWQSPLALIVIPLGAMLLAVVSIFGDLFASLLKRHFGVKDYGILLPGHGGVLDRFDSTIPVAIVLLTLVDCTPLRGLL